MGKILGLPGGGERCGCRNIKQHSIVRKKTVVGVLVTYSVLRGKLAVIRA